MAMDLTTPDSTLVTRLQPSPNHGERRLSIDAIVLHYTGLREEDCEAWTKDPGGEALAWLCEPHAEVSAHYLIHLDGSIVQLVAEHRRAWHAGRSVWQGCADINSCSVGIEIVNTGHAGGLPAYPPSQIVSVIALCRDIARRHGVQPHRILAHSDIAPDRKADPGEHFPWRTLGAANVGHWIEPTPLREGGAPLTEGAQGDEVLALQRALARYGYGVPDSGVFDQATLRVVRAFQRHFRPERVDGAADFSTIDTLRRLSAALPYSAAARA